MLLDLGKRARTAAFVIGAGAFAAALGCSSGDKAQETPGVTRDGSRFVGTVAVYSAMFDDGTGETQYFLRDASASNEVRLWFQDDPGLEPGTALTV
jgi:hypothetical protein